MAPPRKAPPAAVPPPAKPKTPPADKPKAPPPAVPPPPRRRNGLIAVPVDLPTTPAEVVNNVICRDIANPANAPDVVPDPTINIIDTLTAGIVNGSDISDVRDQVQRILSSQREKLEVIAAAMRTHDYWRLNHWLQVRHTAEQHIFQASKRGDLTSTEHLAFMRLAAAEINAITASNRDTQGVDAAALVEKLDSHNTAARDRNAAESMRGTTPHGREIIRKRLYAAKKAAAPK